MFLTVIGAGADSPALTNGIGLKIDFVGVLSPKGSKTVGGLVDAEL